MLRRSLPALVSLALLALSGCGASYERRLTKAVENIKYSARLDKNLNPAPTKPFQSFNVFVRPPKPMVKTEVFQLATLNPGQFDIAETFDDSSTGAKLHVLARYNKPPKQAKNAPPPAPRGPFDPDIIGLLGAVFGDNPGLHSKPKAETKRHNRYQHIALTTANGSEVQTYIYKQGDFNVALVWAYPANQRSAVASKKDLCLESFVYGTRARDAFAGKIVHDEAGAEQGRSTAAF